MNDIVNNELRTFDNVAECQEYIDHTVNKVILVVSGSMGMKIVPEIHTYLNVAAIYLFYGDNEFHKLWSNDFHKVG